jgi:hypothetical protein
MYEWMMNVSSLGLLLHIHRRALVPSRCLCSLLGKRKHSWMKHSVSTLEDTITEHKDENKLSTDIHIC